MGSGRKANYVSKLTSKDTEMLKAFSRVGYITENMLKKNIGVSDKRIINFQRDNYIVKVSYLDKKTKNACFVYRLTNKGKDLCSNQLGVNSFYRSSSPVHDLALAYNYFSIEQELRDSWITESNWRNRFEKYLDNIRLQDFVRWEKINNLWEENKISPPDGGYVNELGIEVAIEVITSSYGSVEIHGKEAFVKILEINYNQIKA